MPRVIEKLRDSLANWLLIKGKIVLQAQVLGSVILNIDKVPCQL
jgi:hypothetical protein